MKKRINVLLLAVILVSLLAARISWAVGGSASAGSSGEAAEAGMQEEVENPDDAEALGEMFAEEGAEEPADLDEDAEEARLEDFLSSANGKIRADSDLVEEELVMLQEFEEDSESAAEFDQKTADRLLGERIAARRAYREFIAGVRPVVCTPESLCVPDLLRKEHFLGKEEWTVRDLADLMADTLKTRLEEAGTGAEETGHLFLDGHYFFTRSGTDKMPHLVFCLEDLSGNEKGRYAMTAVIHYENDSDRLVCSLISDRSGDQELTVNDRGLVSKKWTGEDALAYDRFYSYYYVGRDGEVTHFYSVGYRDRDEELTGRNADEGESVMFSEYYLSGEDPTRDPEGRTEPDCRTLHRERMDRPGMDNTLSYEPAWLYSDSFPLFRSYEAQAARVVDNTVVLQEVLARATGLGVDLNIFTGEPGKLVRYSPVTAALLKVRYSINICPPEMREARSDG